ncbi:MAG: PAS domain S-box protein [Chitinophagaceae bacterium]|nr:PAS domain S-box protein [Chitinophagaceae bacterium]
MNTNETARIETGILNNIFEPVLAFDEHLNYTYANASAAKMVNRTPEQLISKNIRIEFPEAVNSPFQTAMETALKNREYIYIQNYYAPFDNWFENHIYPSENGLVVYFRNITERKKAEDQIIKNEKRFRALIENNDSIIVLLDENRKALYHSPSAERITGWLSGERPEVDALQLPHPDDMPVAIQLYEELKKKPGKLLPLNLRIFHKNGTVIWLEGTVSNLLGEEAVNAVVINVRDITERKKAEEQIRIQRELSDSIINGLPGVFYLFSLDNKIHRWNKNLETVTGFTYEEVRDRHPIEFFHESERGMLMQKSMNVFETGAAAAEGKLVLEDGSTLPYYFSGRVINTNIKR